MLFRSGVRIEPVEIESALLDLEVVKEAAVIAVDNPAGEKELVAYLVAVDREAEPSIEILRHALLEKLPASMLPSEFIFLDSMPLTATGKIDRRALPSLDVAQAEAGKVLYVAPQTPMEKLLVQIGQEVLKVERIGVNDSFFEMGGNSLVAAQFVSRVRKACRVELPFRVVFRTPSIAGIAKYLEEVQAAQQEQASAPVATSDRELGEL